MASKQARQYEVVYIVPAEATEEQVATVQGLVESVVSRYSGTVDNTENWGRRKLAYEIGRHREGTYVLHRVTGPGELVKELDRRFRVADDVLRHLIVRVDEELGTAERTRTRRRERSDRRRAARGLPPQPESRPESSEGGAASSDAGMAAEPGDDRSDEAEA